MSNRRKPMLSGARNAPALVVTLVLVALVLAACPAAPETPADTAAPTATQPPSPTATMAPAAEPTPSPAPEPAAVVPAVSVADQDIAAGTVTVAEVVSAGAGWIVIHADAGGQPGPVIGYAAVADGANLDVSVDVAVDQATETLYAMLHTDGGTVGTYEFPGADGPVSVGDQVVTPAFQVTGGMAMATTEEPVATDQPVEESAAETRTFVIVPEETTAEYSIDETFLNDNNRLGTAIGKTSIVEGSLVLNYADPAQSELGEITVDISTLASDSSRRDNAIRERWLESARFPLASFAAKEIRGFPADPQEGQAIEFQLVGDMKIKETTREQVWDVMASLDGDTLMLADYNVPPPEILGIVRVTDGLTATLDFTMAAQ
jgi:polyisoprenoid-binding protein YceI